MSIQFLNTTFSTPIILASSPLTETAERIHCSALHGAGGVTDRSSVMQMLSCGAALVQVASSVLLHKYNYIQELLPIKEQTALPDPPFSHKSYQVRQDKCTRCYICTKSSAWCDAISIGADGIPFIHHELCENCGWCAGRCPSHAIVGLDE